MLLFHSPHDLKPAIDMFAQLPIVLYIGPDQLMPLTSFLGAVVGMLLMFWNRILGLVRRVGTVVDRRNRPSENDSAS